ncbi:hypothetical protein CEXT_778911 [Caerostris extrusa]|uniref:Uncharacterized protein n=1 Tax=Caerostris extrusa TaxID=172846 RepID=A0AAV4XQR6_CAEEX|nr:hypothetical protein CEXT_778911 [Caerostris extrusa]
MASLLQKHPMSIYAESSVFSRKTFVYGTWAHLVTEKHLLQIQDRVAINDGFDCSEETGKAQMETTLSCTIPPIYGWGMRTYPKVLHMLMLVFLGTRSNDMNHDESGVSVNNLEEES